MKFKIVLALFGVCLLSGCNGNGRFYPVQGPLSMQAPPPIFAAKAAGFFKSGSITVFLNDGEVCKGPWKSITQLPAPTTGTAAAALPPADLSAAWDAVYGPGFYTAHILGRTQGFHAQSALTGNKGTTLQVDLFRPVEPGNATEIRGVAKDNKGNIYKVVF
jgi:hypothetical protein